MTNAATRTRKQIDTTGVPVHFVLPQRWAAANGFGINRVYEFMRREVDPLPHISKGAEYLIDDELAVDWFRRNFGVNCS